MKKIVEVQKISFKAGTPDPDCERCHGDGKWRTDDGEICEDLVCTCKFFTSDASRVEEIVKEEITSERLPDGGVRFHMKEV